MAYYLTVETKKGNHLPLDITKSSCFARMSNLKGQGASLQEIDALTTSFNNEGELRQFLLNEDILPMVYYDKPLAIRKLYKGNYDKVMYDMLYQKDIEYILDPRKIIRKINSYLYNNDFRFIEKFANHYVHYHECSSTAPEVREFARTSSRTGCKSHYLTEPDENYDNILVRMAKLLIYKYYQKPNGCVEYSKEIKYRNLHSIIAFVNNYEKKYAEEIEENIEVSKPKKRTKKREPIEGQFSLF